MENYWRLDLERPLLRPWLPKKAPLAKEEMTLTSHSAAAPAFLPMPLADATALDAVVKGTSPSLSSFSECSSDEEQEVMALSMIEEIAARERHANSGGPEPASSSGRSFRKVVREEIAARERYANPGGLGPALPSGSSYSEEIAARVVMVVA